MALVMCSAGSPDVCLRRRQVATAATTARNETALTTNTVPGPADATRAPPMAGPMAGDPGVITGCSEMAAGSWARGISAGVTALKAGTASDEPVGRANVITRST